MVFFQNNMGIGRSVPEGYAILDFTEAETTGWEWHQLDHMQVICISLQKIRLPCQHLITLFLQAGQCRPTHSVKTLNKVKR